MLLVWKELAAYHKNAFLPCLVVAMPSFSSTESSSFTAYAIGIEIPFS